MRVREKTGTFVSNVLDREISFDPESVPPSTPHDEMRTPLITSLALDVSGRCNLRCVYCAEAATLPNRPAMKRRVLYESICALFKWSPRGRGVSIHLGSGEALLRPSMVREIGLMARDFARRQGRPLALHLTTNGTKVDKSVIHWLVNTGWTVKISIDGEADIHDRYRVDDRGRGTFAKIKEAVLTLAEKIPERFSTTSVLCHGTDPSRVFFTIASMGVRRIELVPVASPHSTAYTLRNSDLKNYRKFILDYVQRIARGDNLPTNIRFQRHLQRVLGYGNTRIPCGAGRSFLAVGPDGILYPCFRFVGLKRFQMGSLNSGTDNEKVQWFVKGPGRPCNSRGECEKCWAAPLCGGPCFACAELMNKTRRVPPHDYCSIVRSEAEAALWLVSVLREENPLRLLRLAGISLRQQI